MSLSPLLLLVASPVNGHHLLLSAISRTHPLIPIQIKSRTPLEATTTRSRPRPRNLVTKAPVVAASWEALETNLTRRLEEARRARRMKITLIKVIVPYLILLIPGIDLFSQASTWSSNMDSAGVTRPMNLLSSKPRTSRSPTVCIFRSVHFLIRMTT